MTLTWKKNIWMMMVMMVMRIESRKLKMINKPVYGPLTIQQYLQGHVTTAIDEAIEIVELGSNLDKVTLLIMLEHGIKRVEFITVTPIEEVINKINEMPANSSLPLANATGNCIMREPTVRTQDAAGNLTDIPLTEASSAGHSKSIVVLEVQIDPQAHSECLILSF